jgi:hypothetical protein
MSRRSGVSDQSSRFHIRDDTVSGIVWHSVTHRLELPPNLLPRLRSHNPPLRTCPKAVNLAETIDRLCRLDDASIEEVVRFVEPLVAQHPTVRPVSAETAWRAGAIRAQFYSKQTPLSLGDSFPLASAEQGDELATADPVVARTARELGLGLVLLRDTSGRLPS